MKLRRIGSTLLALSTAAAAAHAGGLRFEDGSGAAGIDLVTWSGSREKPHILESTGNGLLAVDYDGDGDQDLYVVAAYPLPAGDRPHEGSRLFRNEGGGGFRDVTGAAGAGLDGYGQGGCVGDADGDGLPDLYVTAFGENGLLRNRGNGTFENATATATRICSWPTTSKPPGRTSRAPVGPASGAARWP